MLIRFSVENFRSFDEEETFSMIPGKARKHEKHIIENENNGISTLRLGLLYGANAAGKSNLVKAMHFAQNLVLHGVRPKQAIPLTPFRLKTTSIDKPAKFEFEFIADDQAYSFGFAITRNRVVEEWLYYVHANKKDVLLYERETAENGRIRATFGKHLTEKEDEQLLGFITRSTRPNQLLLTELIDNNMEFFDPVDDWFRSKLVIIFPDSRFQGIQVSVHRDHTFTKLLASFLSSMNTGIDEVCTRKIDPQTIEFPLELIEEDLDKEIETQNEAIEEENEKMVVLDSPNGSRYLLRRGEQGYLQAFSLGTKRKIDGQTVDFDFFEESDGTQRLFDLFPILYANEPKVFVVDELERSLHPNLVHRFLRKFLQSESRSQLIVTTHESTLLDLDWLRRDEIWFVEKSPSGASEVYSLEEFRPRHDLDIRKGYLHGRFGAIPVFGSSFQPVEG